MKLYVVRVQKVAKLNDSRQLDESDYRSKNTDGLQLWSSTIQILLPVAALAVIWGRRGLFTRFLLQFDKNCISVICPSLKDKQRLLQWINHYIPTTWFYIKKSSLDSPINYWKDGSLLCILVNSVVPGACSNPYRHCRHPPSHGQALVYKYLGITPVFTDQELQQKTLTIQQEYVLKIYIEKVKAAVEKTSKLELKYSSIYLAKGMGLVSGEENRKMYFYIYLNSSNSFTANDIIINIRAPGNIYETLTIPSQCIKKSIFRNLLAKKISYQSYSQRLLLKPISGLTSSFVTNQCENSNKKLPITFIVEKEKIKVMYIPKDTGIYEISIITNGCHLLGSPFLVSIVENTSGIIESLEESKSLPLITIKKTIKRRILSQVIDFLDHKCPNETLVSKPSEETKDNNKVNDQDTADCSEINIDSNMHLNKTSLIWKDNMLLNKTSPICEDHIEYEVSSYLKSSVIPNRNPEKILENELEENYLINNEVGVVNEQANIHNELHFNNMLEENVKNENIYNQYMSLDENHNYNEPVKKITPINNNENYSTNNSLNILNYLPQLKYERSKSCNELNKKGVSNDTSFYQTLKSLDTDTDNYFQFKEKLKFWESKSNLKDYKSKPNLLRQRNSLPDLFSDPHDTHLTQSVGDSFNMTEFKSRQKYWSYLSSQTIDCIESGPYYSLPNDFRKEEKKSIAKTKVNDYFLSSRFKSRFKECRNFWEKISSQESLNEYIYFMPKMIEESDNGFENNKNSEVLIHSNSPFDLNIKTFDHSLFQERQNYWEKIGKQSINQDISEYELHNKKSISLNNISFKSVANRRKRFTEDEFAKYSFDEIIIKDENQTNLTDDFKRTNGIRENMKLRFYKNKDFFKSLESGTR